MTALLQKDREQFWCSKLSKKSQTSVKIQFLRDYGILVQVAPPTCSWASSSSSSVCNPLVTVILPTLAIPFAAGIGVIVASSSCLTNWIRPASTQIFGARGRHLQYPGRILLIFPFGSALYDLPLRRRGRWGVGALRFLIAHQVARVQYWMNLVGRTRLVVVQGTGFRWESRTTVGSEIKIGILQLLKTSFNPV